MIKLDDVFLWLSQKSHKVSMFWTADAKTEVGPAPPPPLSNDEPKTEVKDPATEASNTENQENDNEELAEKTQPKDGKISTRKLKKKKRKGWQKSSDNQHKRTEGNSWTSNWNRNVVLIDNYVKQVLPFRFYWKQAGDIKN